MQAIIRLTVCLLIFGAAPVAIAQDAPVVTEGFINAPLHKVWSIFTTAEGLRATGVTQADVDLRLGGHIRTEGETPGDAAIVREVLAFEPQRMLAMRITQAPVDMAHREALMRGWTVTYFTPSGEAMTHVRMVGVGFDEDASGKAARDDIAARHRQMLDHVAKQYWPACARCAKE